MPKESYIVFLGGPCIDEYYHVDRWPEEGDKYVALFQGPVAGGMIANAACVMAGYGKKTYCFYGMSRGESADFLVADLEAYHVDTSKIIFREKARDGKCLIFQHDGERTICVIPGDPWQIRLTDAQTDFLCKAECVYTTLSNLKDYEEPLIMFNNLKKHGVKIVTDNEASTIIEHWEDYLQGTYLASMNDYAMNVYGDGLTVDQMENKMLDLGVQIFVETLGEHGCRVVTKEEKFSLPSYDVDVVDTTGAGDTFNTSFTYALSTGRNLYQAAEFATAAACMAIGKQGPRSGITDEQKVQAFMAQHKLKER
jgi:sugar/nucleoside kinase (ribokinase family)